MLSKGFILDKILVRTAVKLTETVEYLWWSSKRFPEEECDARMFHRMLVHYNIVEASCVESVGCIGSKWYCCTVLLFRGGAGKESFASTWRSMSDFCWSSNSLTVLLLKSCPLSTILERFQSNTRPLTHGILLEIRSLYFQDIGKVRFCHRAQGLLWKWK